MKTDWKNRTRRIEPALAGDEELGPYKWLPTEGDAWINEGQYGWNLIALPFVDDKVSKSRGYRVLVNKYSEELEFKLADKGAPNRGVEPADGNDCPYTKEKEGQNVNGYEECFDKDKTLTDCFERPAFIQTDQFVVALDYEQEINQVDAIEFPVPDEPRDGKAPNGAEIHHEPGLFMMMTEQSVATVIQRKPTVRKVPLNLARLATIPHGTSVLALGSCEHLNYADSIVKKIIDSEPVLNPDNTVKKKAVTVADDALLDYLAIPELDKEIGLPIGTTQDLTLESSSYLEPYTKTKLETFDPVFPQQQLFKDLKSALGIDDFSMIDDPQQFPIKKTTRIWFDSELETAGILNIPFVTRQANAAAMRSTFWIHELDDSDNPKLILQYLQVVLLDFHLIRSDDRPGRIRWPHISINTLIKSAKRKH